MSAGVRKGKSTTGLTSEKLVGGGIEKGRRLDLRREIAGSTTFARKEEGAGLTRL